jgi:hypothetical protein
MALSKEKSLGIVAESKRPHNKINKSHIKILFSFLDIVDVSSMVRSNSSMNGSTSSSNGSTGSTNGFTGSSHHKLDFNNSFPPRKRSIPLGEL